MSAQKFQASLVNAVNAQNKTLQRELNAMQMFLAVMLSKREDRTLVVTKEDIEFIHVKNLAELTVTPGPDQSFVLKIEEAVDEQPSNIIKLS